MSAISKDAAAIVAASLTQAAATIKAERQRSMGIVQTDPDTDAQLTYATMLRFVVNHDKEHR